MASTESVEQSFVCGACGRSFETRRELERHVFDVGLVY